MKGNGSWRKRNTEKDNDVTLGAQEKREILRMPLMVSIPSSTLQTLNSTSTERYWDGPAGITLLASGVEYLALYWAYKKESLLLI